MTIEVVRRRAEPSRVVEHQPDRTVAAAAQDPAVLAGHVVVVRRRPSHDATTRHRLRRVADLTRFAEQAELRPSTFLGSVVRRTSRDATADTTRRPETVRWLRSPIGVLVGQLDGAVSAVGPFRSGHNAILPVRTQPVRTQRKAVIAHLDAA